jgi:hypothetical protein
MTIHKAPAQALPRVAGRLMLSCIFSTYSNFILWVDFIFFLCYYPIHCAKILAIIASENLKYTVNKKNPV